MLFCKDTDCQTHYSGSPITVPYNIHVLTALKLDVPQLNVTVNVGELPSVKHLGFTPPENTPNLEVRLFSPAEWIAVNKVDNTVDVTLQRLPPGTWTAQIDFVNTDTGSVVGSIPVVYNVLSTDSTILTLTVAPETANFAATEGLTAASQDVTINVPSWATAWDLSLTYGNGGQGWLNVQRLDDSHLRLTASAAALQQGQYTATIHLSTSGLQSSSIDFPVTFNVGSGFALPSQFYLPVSVTTTEADLSKTVVIEHQDGRHLAWSATSNAAWLTLDTASGVSSVDALRFHVSANNVAVMANASSASGTITVTIANQPYTFPINVALNKQLPVLRTAMPVGLPVGKERSLILHGDFNGVDLDRFLALQNATVKSIARLGNSALDIRLTPISEGLVNFTLTNALGINPTQLSVAAVTPLDAVGYQETNNTWRVPRRPFYDPVRNVFWAVSPQEGLVRRYTLVNGAWTVNQRAFVGLVDAAMTPDGNSVAVLSEGRLDLMNPSTLALTGSSYPSDVPPDNTTIFWRGTQFYNPSFNNGLVALNDNTLHLTLGANQWMDALLYDLNTRTFAGWRPGGYNGMEYYNGPSYVASANGEFMFIDTYGSYARYQTSTNTVIKPVPQGLGGSSFVGSYSADASRLLLQCQALYDQNMALVGLLPLQIEPENYVRSCVMSPDGQRAYVFTERYLAPVGYELPLDTSRLPRVYVLDATQRPIDSVYLTVLGYFEVRQHVSSRAMDSYYLDASRGGMVGLGIDSAGSMLFVTGESGSVIEPIPAALTTLPGVTITKAKTTGGKAKMNRLGVLLKPKAH